MEIHSAKFTVGQIVRHNLFQYRGVIVDADPVYSGSDEWYLINARTLPPKDQPWYRVWVHNAIHETYVAERNLQLDDSDEPVNHPMVDDYFNDFIDGQYILKRPCN